MRTKVTVGGSSMYGPVESPIGSFYIKPHHNNAVLIRTAEGKPIKCYGIEYSLDFRMYTLKGAKEMDAHGFNSRYVAPENNPEAWGVFYTDEMGHRYVAPELRHPFAHHGDFTQGGKEMVRDIVLPMVLGWMAANPLAMAEAELASLADDEERASDECNEANEAMNNAEEKLGKARAAVTAQGDVVRALQKKEPIA